jgi:acyl phosphate:glycerol-3-phosphate acyltransferase
MAIAFGAILGYLIGSLPLANAVARRAGLPDLRAVGDRNPGYWNARAHLGRRASALVFALDTAKGAVAAGAGLALGGWEVGAAAWAGALVGHAFPVFARFRGGRSVLCFVGGGLVLVPLAALVAVAACALVTAWRGFARGAQVGLTVTPFAVWAIDGAGHELAVTVGLLVAIGVRALVADRALRRAGIAKPGDAQ